MMAIQAQLPIYIAEGTVEAVRVHAEGRGHRSEVRIRAESGAELQVNASGRSPYFRAGERVRVRYQGYTGSILKAEFLSQTGQKEGVFNGTDTWPPYFMFLGGLLLAWAGIQKHRRDPEGFGRRGHLSCRGE
jgi:hypothetical protein